VVKVQVADQNFIQLVSRDAEGCQAFGGAFAHIEDKLVTVTQLDKMSTAE
jgi:hypothetical protein